MSELVTTNQTLSTKPPVRTAETIAAEIRALTASMLSNVLEIGRRMCEVKEMLPHGSFGAWIRENTGYSPSTANNFMRLFQEYGATQGSLFGTEINCQTFGNLSYSKALALLSVPAEDREEFVRDHDVEAMSTRELQQAIQERDRARAEAEAARQDSEGAAMAMAELEDQLAEARTRIQNLELAEEEAARKAREAEETADAFQAELEQLKSQPVEPVGHYPQGGPQGNQNEWVAVQVQDASAEQIAQARAEAAKEAVREARKAARAEAEREAQKARDKADRELKSAQAQLEQANKALAMARAEREAVQKRAVELEQKLAAAGKREAVRGDPDLVEFQVHFNAAKEDVEKTKTVLDRVAAGGGGELAQKLRRAMAALGQLVTQAAE